MFTGLHFLHILTRRKLLSVLLRQSYFSVFFSSSQCCTREFAAILKSRTGLTKVRLNATKCYGNKPQFVEETGKEDIKPSRLCSPSSHSRKEQNADFLSSDLFDRPAVCSRKSENWKGEKPQRHRVLRRQNRTRRMPQL